MVLDTLAAGRGYTETWQQGQVSHCIFMNRSIFMHLHSVTCDGSNLLR
jgi:hypothetical protein